MDMLYVGLCIAVASFVYMVWCFVQVFLLKPKTGRGRFAFSQEFTGGWESGQRKIRAVTLSGHPSTRASSGGMGLYDITNVNRIARTPAYIAEDIVGIWTEEL